MGAKKKQKRWEGAQLIRLVRDGTLSVLLGCKRGLMAGPQSADNNCMTTTGCGTCDGIFGS